MNEIIKLVVAGDQGRMGSIIKKMATDDDQHRFNPVIGFDKGDDSSIIARGDVVIDFTVPAATLVHVDQAKAAKKAIVIGTTGLSSADMAIIGQAALVIPI